jgi:hypothetical protein
MLQGALSIFVPRCRLLLAQGVCNAVLAVLLVLVLLVRVLRDGDVALLVTRCYRLVRGLCVLVYDIVCSSLVTLPGLGPARTFRKGF